MPSAVHCVVAIHISQRSCVGSLPSFLFTPMEMEKENLSRIPTTFTESTTTSLYAIVLAPFYLFNIMPDSVTMTDSNSKTNSIVVWY